MSERRWRFSFPCLRLTKHKANKNNFHGFVSLVATDIFGVDLSIQRSWDQQHRPLSFYRGDLKRTAPSTRNGHRLVTARGNRTQGVCVAGDHSITGPPARSRWHNRVEINLIPEITKVRRSMKDALWKNNIHCNCWWENYLRSWNESVIVETPDQNNLTKVWFSSLSS